MIAAGSSISYRKNPMANSVLSRFLQNRWSAAIVLEISLALR